MLGDIVEELEDVVARLGDLSGFGDILAVFEYFLDAPEADLPRQHHVTSVRDAGSTTTH